MTAEYLRLNGASGAMASNWGNNKNLRPGTDFHDGAWHHLAKIFDGRKATFYVDGASVLTLPAHGTLVFSCPARAVAPGALVLARAPADLDGWTWRDATGLPAAGTVIRFAVEGDALVAHVLRAGTLLLVR